MKRAVLLLVGLLAACTMSARPTGLDICVTDEQCDSGQLCFAEGCGDPGKNVVVEVTGGSLTGQFAREFPQPTGTLRATQNFDLGPALSINGQFQRAVSSAITETTSYTDPVVVRAVGQSQLLPGITRSFEARFDKPERGFFEMKVGAGDFVLTATPVNPVVPPAVTTAQIGLGTAAPPVTFAFPAVDGAPALAGQLIKRLDSRFAPPEPVLIGAVYLAKNLDVPVVELQLLDPETGLPLSQRVPVSGTTGEFAMIVSPEARSHRQLTLVASPREPGVAIPTKRFLLDTPLPSIISLEYGDFGEEGALVGTIVDSVGSPVAGAQVLLEGTVGGDGTFRSKTVETDAAGEFRLNTLPSKSDGSFQFTVVPPRGSRAAYTQRSVTVRVAAGVATMSPAQIALEDRLVTLGTVTKPRGEPAVGVVVHATRQPDPNSTESRALPVEPAETVTDIDGTFRLPLDPGTWRFEYMPSDVAPLASRLITVQATLDDKGRKVPTLELPEVQLAFGRTVSGVVTATMANAGDPVPYSQLRFFRVASVGGKPTSVLLGSTIADGRGHYSVVLPTVTAPADAGM